jgi:hypothetical protein
MPVHAWVPAKHARVLHHAFLSAAITGILAETSVLCLMLLGGCSVTCPPVPVSVGSCFLWPARRAVRAATALCKFSWRLVLFHCWAGRSERAPLPSFTSPNTGFLLLLPEFHRFKKKGHSALFAIIKNRTETCMENRE